jgi:exosortase
MTPGDQCRKTAGLNSFPWTLRLSAIMTAFLFATWCWLMGPQWMGEPNLMHGLLMPVVFAALVYEGATSGSNRFLPDTVAMDLLQFLTASIGLLAAAAGTLYGATMGWDHALASFLLGAALAALLLSMLMAFSRRGTRLIAFGWPCVAAILLCLLCAPMPPGTAARLTSLLQLGVTQAVLQMLNAIGIPAFTTGNVIELAHARVGVDEACSGLRSLVSCVFAGVFISAAWVRTPLARVLVVLLAAPLAIGMNLLRSFALAYAAERGLRADGPLHDFAGIAILAFTSILLVLVGVAFGAKATPRPRRAESPALRPRRAPGWIALGAALAAVAMMGASALISHRAARPSGRLPDLASILPDKVPGWQVSAPDYLGRFSSELRTSCLLQRSYSRPTPTGREEVTIYVAYWRPGQAPVTFVSSHTPDMCWPGLGWRIVPEVASTPVLRVDQLSLPPAQARSFERSAEALNVWYWHLYGGHVVEHFDPHSPLRVLSDAVKNGARANRSQLFLRISANAVWPDIADGALLPTLFAGLHEWGF